MKPQKTCTHLIAIITLLITVSCTVQLVVNEKNMCRPQLIKLGMFNKMQAKKKRVAVIKAKLKKLHTRLDHNSTHITIKKSN
jgi:hypothetical protein